MSRYLAFVLDRAGVSRLDSVLILQHSLEWANRQIIDEFRAVSGELDVKILPEIVHPMCDLVVLPYVDDFVQEQPGDVALYRQLRSLRETCVMLYGLGYRKIDVMPAPELLAHYKRSQRVRSFIQTLDRLHLLTLIRWMYRVREASRGITRLREVL